MKQFLWFMLFACGGLLSACQEEDGLIFVRIFNGSDITYDQVSQWGIAENESFGALAPGDTSMYRQSASEYGPPLILK